MTTGTSTTTRAASLHPPGRILSLGTKLTFATVCVLAVASTFLFFELTQREWRALLAAKTQAASMVSDLFAATVAAPVDFFATDPESLQTELGHLETNPDVTCAVVWAVPDGHVLGRVDRGGCGDLQMPPEMALGKVVVLGDRVQVSRLVKSPTNGAPIGRTTLVFSLASENEAYAASRMRIFILSFALAAVTSFVLIWITRRQIVSPLGMLTRASRHIGRGDFGTRVEVRSRDEIGELARAFDKMRAAIADREHRLDLARQELRDLFDNMRQAIFAFGREGRVVGAVSKQATRLFDRVTLEGERVRDLLYAGAAPNDVDAQAFDEWSSMAFDVPLDEWASFAQLAPREVTIRRGAEQVPLELEMRPVLKKGELDCVMVLATDVSEKKHLEKTVQTQEEEHARRMAAMRRLIAGGGQVFVQFMDAARERIKRCIELVGPNPRMLRTGEIDELFRHVHTIKGEARAFDLRELESETAKMEEELDELRALARGEGFVTTGSVHGALVSRLHRALAGIDKGAEVFVAASPLGRAALDQITVQRPDVQAVVDMSERLGNPELTRAVAALASRPFGESIASLMDMAPTWGDREGKQVRLDVDGREVRVPAKLARVLPGVLTHLVRNAIAHGIEPPAGRIHAGKPNTGTVRVTAKPGGGSPTILIEDDGRGLDYEAIRERAKELGLDVSGRNNHSLTELVFVAGLTTVPAAGTLAGRGVGLGAVRDDLARVGYRIDVASEPGKYTRFTLCPA
ncbi:MAG TPA: HAMP domain-containing protein [Polyangiaceae bacterium]|nr:HAMP domain-containing protein [Polyangiaceae bacterium]